MQRSDACTDYKGLWELALSFFHDHDVTMPVCHHVHGAYAEQGVLRITADGFPDSWLCAYIGWRLYPTDPIRDLAARLSDPFR